jgi:hypothetical protein
MDVTDVEKKSKCLSVEKLCELLPAYINNRMPTKFPCKLHVVRTEQTFQILEELENEVVKPLSLEHAAGHLMRFAASLKSEEFLRVHLPSNAKNVIKTWGMRETNILTELPPAFRFKSEKGLCFKRIPFDVSPVNHMDDCPTWAEIASRCDNWKALCTWVWSLFQPESDRSQYLYIYGAGGDSKSRVANSLVELFGAAGKATSSEAMKRAHFTASLVGKRLCYITECSAGFTSTSLFKALTGDEYIEAERKYEAPFTFNNQAKFIITSNKEPIIDSSPADQRRIVLVRFSRYLGDLLSEAETNKLLMKEMPAFLNYCKQCWIENDATVVKYETDYDFLNTEEEFYLKIFEQHFKQADQSKRVPRKFVADILSKLGIKDSYKVNAVKAAWEQHFGVRVKSVRENGAPVRIYCGLELLPTTTYGRRQLDDNGDYFESKPN